MAQPSLARTPGAALVEAIRNGSRLSQAEIARRAGLSRSVLNVYLHGRREPGANVLARIAAAAGFELRPVRRRAPVDPKEAGLVLEQVIGLAEALPYRPREELTYPVLRDRLDGEGRGRDGAR